MLYTIFFFIIIGIIIAGFIHEGINIRRHNRRVRQSAEVPVYNIPVSELDIEQEKQRIELARLHRASQINWIYNPSTGDMIINDMNPNAVWHCFGKNNKPVSNQAVESCSFAGNQQPQHTGQTDTYESESYQPFELNQNRIWQEDDFIYNPDIATNGITIMNAVNGCERGLIIGGTRAGKTHFCKQLGYQFIQQGFKVFALDCKKQEKRDPWAEGTVIIGTGDNWNEIDEFWAYIRKIKEKREDDIDNINKYPFIAIFFDEISTTLDERPDFAKPYRLILSKYAQFKIGIFCIGQSDTAKDVGLDGHYKLMACFEFKARFVWNRQTGERIQFIDYQDGEGWVRCVPYKPVSFTSDYTATRQKKSHENGAETHTHGTKDKNDTLPKVLGIHPVKPDSDNEKMIIEMCRNGESLSEICRAVYGSKGGFQAKQIKAVLLKHGILYE